MHKTYQSQLKIDSMPLNKRKYKTKILFSVSDLLSFHFAIQNRVKIQALVYFAQWTFFSKKKKKIHNQNKKNQSHLDDLRSALSSSSSSSSSSSAIHTTSITKPNLESSTQCNEVTDEYRRFGTEQRHWIGWLWRHRRSNSLKTQRWIENKIDDDDGLRVQQVAEVQVVARLLAALAP